MASCGSGFQLAVPLAYFRNFHISPWQVFRLRGHGVNLLWFASITSGPGCGRLAQGKPKLHVQRNRPRNPEAVKNRLPKSEPNVNVIQRASFSDAPTLAAFRALVELGVPIPRTPSLKNIYTCGQDSNGIEDKYARPKNCENCIHVFFSPGGRSRVKGSLTWTKYVIQLIILTY
jgi:hypothetical protein